MKERYADKEVSQITIEVKSNGYVAKIYTGTYATLVEDFVVTSTSGLMALLNEKFSNQRADQENILDNVAVL